MNSNFERARRPCKSRRAALAVLACAVLSGCAAKAGSAQAAEKRVESVAAKAADPLSGVIRARSQYVIGGASNWFDVELLNNSDSDLVVVLPSRFVRSTEFATRGTIGGEVVGSSHRFSDLAGCPGELDLYIIRAGGSLLRLVQLEVPSEPEGRATVTATIDLLMVGDALDCNSGKRIKVNASGSVMINSPSRKH